MKPIKFVTPYDPSLDITTCPGSPLKDLYKAEVDDNGVMDLVKTGVDNLYLYIQSHADSVDLNLIMKRFASDPEALNERLNARRGDFADLTCMPTTYAEALQKIIDAQGLFNELPTDTKSLFNNNYMEFIAAIGTEKFNKVFEDNLQSSSGVVSDVPAADEGGAE